jgi:hypothetical protein
MLGIVKANGFLVSLPECITRQLESAKEVYMTYPPPNKKGAWVPKPVRVPAPTEVDFYWVVSCVADLVNTVAYMQKGNVMNLVNHAWAITDFQGQRRFKHIPTCIVPICGVREMENNGVKFEELRAEYISMHFKEGCLSISPNNHKVRVTPEMEVNKFWTISLSDEEPKAIVTLQWLLMTEDLNHLFFSANDLAELLAGLQDPLLGYIFKNVL